MKRDTLKIHSKNILPIIKKWLYTDKEIFLRELVSNSCDAIGKLRALRSQNKVSCKDGELRIDISIDKEKRTLSILDTGIGMSAEEVEKYIAQLAFSGAEDFVKKYQTSGEKGGIIGHFGLGFYSSFMVSDKVEIDTLSFQEGVEPAFWSCDGSSDYLLGVGNRKERGTQITLYISRDEGEFLEEERLRSILLKHCRFLSYPLFLNGKRINDKEPIWIKSPSECTDRDYIDFYRALYPFEADPVFWVYLNIDYPFHLKGVLYFAKLDRRLDNHAPSIHLYYNRIFVSDDCGDLVPDYLSILRGVLDSPDLPLNVSRSNLQVDRTVRQLKSYIPKKIAEKLTSFYMADREKFIEMWSDIELFIKLGILQDRKFFDWIKSCLIWKTSDDRWSTIPEYLERHREKTGGKVFYYQGDDKNGSHLFDMYREKGVEVLFAPFYLDIPIITFLEGEEQGVVFQRLDSSLDETILDRAREKTVLDAEGKTEAVHIAQFIRSHLSGEKVDVEGKSLASDKIPALILIGEKERRLREHLSLTGRGFPEQTPGKQTFVVNTNSPLIHAIRQLDKRDPELARTMVVHLYETALLEQRELDPKRLSDFFRRANGIQEKLLGYAVR